MGGQNRIFGIALIALACITTTVCGEDEPLDEVEGEVSTAEEHTPVGDFALLDASFVHEVEDYLKEHPPLIHETALQIYWGNAIRFTSEDGVIHLNIRGRALLDVYWVDSPDYSSDLTQDGTFPRQIRIGIQGEFLPSTEFVAEVEFRVTEFVLQDVFFGLTNLGPLGRLRVGHQREPFSIDGVTPIPFHVFMERAPSTQAFARPRNSGFRLLKSTAGGRLAWSAGLYWNTDSFGESFSRGGRVFTFRISGLPVRDRKKRRKLHLGLSCAFESGIQEVRVRTRPGPRAGPFFLKTEFIPASSVARFAFEFAAMGGPFVMQAEMFLAHLSGRGTSATLSGGYLSTTYWITGERSQYNLLEGTWSRVIPNSVFHDGKGGSGAWALSARFDHTDLNDDEIQGGVMTSVTVGAIWMWNANIRLLANAVAADVDGGPLGSGKLYYLMTRLQMDF